MSAKRELKREALKTVTAETIGATSADHADRLRAAAFELACERGFAELSARNLAAYTGGSPSAVNYHFGGREQLLLAVYEEVSVHMTAAREAALVQCLSAVPSWADLPDVFTALLQARMSRERGVQTLLLELEQEVVAGREPQLRAAADAELARERAFWIDLAKRFGASEDAAVAWSSLAHGLIGLLLCETDVAIRSAWISAPATRLHQRITGRPVVLLPMHGPTAQAGVEAYAQRMPASNETAQRILDAALMTIAKKGADRLVQREIATMVGVSLAAVTYFFRTKHDLISAAFGELCRRMRAGVEALEAMEASSDHSLMKINDRDTYLQALALTALLRAAVRDDSLVPIARDIRQMRGIGSYIMFRKRGVSADWLDAYTWGVFTTGRYRDLQFLEPAEIEAGLVEFATRTLAVVFAPS